MRNRNSVRGLGAVVCALVAFGSSSALAGDFYLSGRIGIASGTGTVDSRATIAQQAPELFVCPNSPAAPSCQDSDSSPLLGASLGYGATFEEAFPWNFGLFDWAMRLEIEGLAGQDYEFQTLGFQLPNPLVTTPGAFNATVDSWTFMSNFWLDIPIHRPLAALFGRIAFLEPVTLYGGVGVGFVSSDLVVKGLLLDGATKDLQFAWQGGIGAGYALTERVNFNLGYRFQDLGGLDVDLVGSPVIGFYQLTQTADQFVVGIRVNFWELAFPGSKRYQDYQ